MYHHLRGKVIDLSPTCLVIEAGGVGYDVKIPLSTYDSLKGKRDAMVLTHVHVREDDWKIFGFATKEERDLFRLLLGVNGVGPSTALAALCTFPPEELAWAIANADTKTVQRVKGVGKRLAERMALELRDRVAGLLPGLGEGRVPRREVEHGAAGRIEALQRAPEVAGAVGALVSLGFDRKTAEDRVEATWRRLREKDPEARVEVESLIKDALRGG